MQRPGGCARSLPLGHAALAGPLTMGSRNRPKPCRPLAPNLESGRDPSPQSSGDATRSIAAFMPLPLATTASVRGIPAKVATIC